MNQNDFLLDSRYRIRPSLNIIWDSTLQTEVRIEPRLMQLLCILASYNGQLVSREQLVREIWNDYGGGEDGLTHAISLLRKLLHDSSKELIETIPKKGYILHARLTEWKGEADEQWQQEKRFRKKPILSMAAIVLAGCAVYGFWQLSISTGKTEQNFLLTAKEVSVPFSEVNKKVDESWQNTVITVGGDGTQYKLKMIGDRPPEFYINGRLLSPPEMERHLDLIDNLKEKLQTRRQKK